MELGTDLGQAAGLVGAANRADQESAPDRILVASIMAGSGTDRELAHWQTLATACQDEGADAFELNLSCPHMDRKDMGSNIGKDQELISIGDQVVKEVARVPVWAKLTPSTTDIVEEARAAFLGGADAISSSNTFPSLPLIDPETLEFEMNVDGLVSSGGLGGPAILPLSLAKMAQLTQAFPDDGVLRHRRHRRVRSRAQLLPARVRNGAGVHCGNARSRDWPERHRRPDAGARSVSASATPTRAGVRSTTSAAFAAIASSRTRRSGGRTPKEYSADTRRRGVCAGRYAAHTSTDDDPSAGFRTAASS